MIGRDPGSHRISHGNPVREYFRGESWFGANLFIPRFRKLSAIVRDDRRLSIVSVRVALPHFYE